MGGGGGGIPGMGGGGGLLGGGASSTPLPRQNSKQDQKTTGTNTHTEASSKSKDSRLYTASIGSSVLCSDMGENEWPAPTGADFIPVYDLPLHLIMRRRSHHAKTNDLKQKMKDALDKVFSLQMACKEELKCPTGCKVTISA